MTITHGDVEVRLSRGDLEDVRTVLDALERLRQTGGDESTRDDGGEPRDENRDEDGEQ
jgi:hypothetical protein